MFITLVEISNEKANDEFNKFLTFYDSKTPKMQAKIWGRSFKTFSSVTFDSVGSKIECKAQIMYLELVNTVES